MSFSVRGSNPGNSALIAKRPGSSPVIVATPLSFVVAGSAAAAAGAAGAFGSTAGVTVTFALGITAPV